MKSSGERLSLVPTTIVEDLPIKENGKGKKNGCRSLRGSRLIPFDHNPLLSVQTPVPNLAPLRASTTLNSHISQPYIGSIQLYNGVGETIALEHRELSHQYHYRRVDLVSLVLGRGAVDAVVSPEVLLVNLLQLITGERLTSSVRSIYTGEKYPWITCTRQLGRRGGRTSEGDIPLPGKFAATSRYTKLSR